MNKQTELTKEVIELQNGQSIKIEYDTFSGQLSSVHLPNGTWSSFIYDSMSGSLSQIKKGLWDSPNKYVNEIE